MKANPSPHTSSLGLLFRQYWIYHSKLMLTTALGMIIGLFVLLYSIQIYTRFDTWNYDKFILVFFGFFTIMAVLFSGSSFPGLRSKDKMYTYLLLPVTTEEKYFFELTTRVVLFVFLIPGLYWCIFHVQGNLVQLLNPDFTFRAFSFTEGFHLPTSVENNLAMAMVVSLGLLFLTVPFCGATLFMKQPIIKTIAGAVVILFIHLIVLNEIQTTGVRLTRVRFEIFVTAYVLIINIGMMVIAYFKLKHKQG